jgi:hypothetical protein
MASSKGDAPDVMVAVRPVGRPIWQQATYRLATVHNLQLTNPSSPVQGLRAWVWCDEAADDNGDPLHVCDGADRHQVVVNVRRADNPHSFELLVSLATAR